MTILNKIIRFSLLLLSYILNLFGGIMLLGGPDPHFLSKISLIMGFTALLLSSIIVFFVGLDTKNKKVLYSPIFVSLIAWVIALLSHFTGAKIILYGIPIVSILTLIYFLISNKTNS